MKGGQFANRYQKKTIDAITNQNFAGLYAANVMKIPVT